MFKLKVSKADHDTTLQRLKLVETPRYSYVITDDKELVEDDKLNIVFQHADILKVSNVLDLIVKGEAVHIVGYNEFGQKTIECRNIHYFIVELDDVYAALHNTRLIVKMKLYELEDLLSDKDFIRVSKYCLVNIGKIEYIRSALNSKLNLLMKNGDNCEVNRSYLKDFKSALKL